MLCTFLLIFVLNLTVSDSARILCLGSSPSYSHQIVFRAIWEALARNGHDLVVLTTDPWTNPNLTNIKQIDLHEAYQYWSAKNLTDLSLSRSLRIIKDIFKMVDDVMDYELTHPDVQGLIRNESEHFDLFIGEIISPVLAGFSYRFNCPYITLLSMDAPSLLYSVMGNPINPVLYPDGGTPFLPPLTLIERCFGVLFHFLIHMGYGYFYLPYAEQQLTRYFIGNNRVNNDRVDIRQLIDNMSLALLNTNPILFPTRPLTINTIQIGGGIHLTPPKPLPLELQRFIDSSGNGVIYMSLGTNIKQNSLSEEFINTFLMVFKQLPYRILWKFDAELENLPENVKIIKWAPQQDVLRHDNVKLFIMQCGLQSLEEAIFYHTPVICIPFFADQFTNSKLIERHQIGIKIDKDQVDKLALLQIINELIHNSTYKNNLQKMSELMRDQPLSGVEKAVWWSEYVIRHKGARHFKNPVNNLPFYQVYHLDVITIYLLILTLISLLICKLFKLVKRLFCDGKIKTE